MVPALPIVECLYHFWGMGSSQVSWVHFEQLCIISQNQVVIKSLGSCTYSALPDVYGQLHLISNTQNISLKSWWVGKIIEHGFKRMIITK
jgi:hypothetical protein